jgi:hypothetical protein
MVRLAYVTLVRGLTKLYERPAWLVGSALAQAGVAAVPNTRTGDSDDLDADGTGSGAARIVKSASAITPSPALASHNRLLDAKNAVAASELVVAPGTANI